MLATIDLRMLDIQKQQWPVPSGSRSPVRETMVASWGTMRPWETAAARRVLKISGRHLPSISVPTKFCWCFSQHLCLHSTCRQIDQLVEIDEGPEMRCQTIKRRFDKLVVGNFWLTAAESLQPGGALPIVGEQAVDISANQTSIR